MQEYYLIYDTATGNVSQSGQGPAGTALEQNRNMPEGLAVIAVPQETALSSHLAPDEGGNLARTPFDYTALKLALATQVGASAEAVRSQFITAGSGKAMDYIQKSAELDAFAADADNEAATPFLNREATDRGIARAAVAAEWGAARAFWLDIGAKINGAEMKAKHALEAAANLKEIVEGGTVDWDAVVAG